MKLPTSTSQLEKTGPRCPSRLDPVTIEWAHYPRLNPGKYLAYCSWAGTYYDRAFKRWTCLLRFDLLSENLLHTVARVPMWLSLGGGEKPKAPRRGRYWAEWIRASGQQPRRGDRLSPHVFVHRIAYVEVADTFGDAPYSVVRRIIEWQTGAASLSQQVTQSRTAVVRNTK